MAKCHLGDTYCSMSLFLSCLFSLSSSSFTSPCGQTVKLFFLHLRLRRLYIRDGQANVHKHRQGNAGTEDWVQPVSGTKLAAVWPNERSLSFMWLSSLAVVSSFVFFSGQKEEAEASVCLHITPSCKWGVLVMKSHLFGAQTELIVFRKKQPSVYIWTEQQHLV